MTHHPVYRTDPQVERKVLTRIAEHVKYMDISEETGVPVSTIKKIKARNVELLAEIKQLYSKQEAAIVTRNLQKANRLLEKRLDRALTGKEDIPNRELVAIAKEMFNQSRLEQGKPTGIINNQAQEDVSPELQAAIESENFELMAELLWPKKATTSKRLDQPTPIGKVPITDQNKQLVTAKIPQNS